MKHRKIITLFIALTMVLALCACGGNETEEFMGSQQESSEVVQYTVWVIDEEGNPMSDIQLKFSKSSGDVTVTTDEEGTAQLTCFATEITVTLVDTPAGYLQDETEYYLGEETETTIILSYV